MASVNPLAVSAVIPTYNRAHLLPRSIGSALAALGPGDEVVVVDDGSTDGTVALVESYGAPVRLVRGEHAGAGAARNLGFAAAKGPLVAFLDSDDEWFPDKIELQRGFLEARPEAVYCCSDFAIKLEDGGERHNWLNLWLDRARPLAKLFGPGLPYSSFAPLSAGRADFQVYYGDMYRIQLRRGFIAAFTLMVRKEGASDLHFATDLATAEEWPAFGALTGRGPGALFDLETARQHGHEGPRLTQASLSTWADAWLAGLERVWGSDSEFLAAHGHEYRAAVDEIRLIRAVAGARGGEPGQWRRALRLAAGEPRALLGAGGRFGSRYRRMIDEELRERLARR
jgi:glycosyltransferase involved in cell wall biosynthesis